MDDMENTAKTGIEIIFQIIRMVIPLVISWAVVRVVLRSMSRERLKGNLALTLLRSVLVALIWAIGIFASMGQIDAFTKTWETVLASTSVAGVVFGLAAQDTLGNVFSGISMTLGSSRPFSIGDRIQIGDSEPGYVEDITLRHVEIRTYFNERIYIPNAMAASSKIINFTKAEGYSHTIDVSIAYESDIGKAIGIMKDVIIHHPKYQGDGEPSVLCKEAGESGILLRGVVSTGSFADNPGACSDCLMEIIRRYAEEGIEIPYNKLEIVKLPEKNGDLARRSGTAGGGHGTV